MITRDEALTANMFHEHFPERDKCRKWRRNGKTRTWKRDMQRIEVPVKFGLRYYYTIGYSDLLNPNLHTEANCPHASK